MILKTEINLKYFTGDTSDSNTSEETVYCKEPKNPVSNKFFSDTNVILDSTPDSSDDNNLPFAPTIWAKNSKFINTESTVQISSKCKKFNSSIENSIGPTLANRRLPLSPIPVAPAITPANTPRPLHIKIRLIWILLHFYYLLHLLLKPSTENQNLSSLKSQLRLQFVLN